MMDRDIGGDAALPAAYESLFQFMPIPAYTWRRVGDEFVLIDCNLAARQITQERISDWIGRTAREMFPDEPGIEAAIETCWFEQRPLREHRNHRLRSTNTNLELAVTYTPVGNDLVVVYTEDITERMRADRAIRESELKYRLLFECAADAFFVLDETGRLLDANARAVEILGYSLAELRMRSIADLIPAGDLERDPLALPKVLDGATISRERRIIHKNGTIFPMEITAAPLPARRALASLRDLSKLHAAEEESQRTASVLSRVLESLPVGVWVFDRTGRITLVNPAGATICGTSRDVAIHRGWWPHDGRPVRPDEWPAMQTLRTNTPLYDVPIDIEVGEPPVRKRILISSLPLAGRDGSIAGAIAVVQDVTSQTRTQETLRRSEQQHRLVIESVSDVVVVLTENGEVRFASPSVEDALGYSPAEIKGRLFREVVEPDDAAVLAEVFRCLRADLERSASVTLRMRHRSGGLRVLEVVARGRMDERGSFELVASARDVTDRNRLTAQLEQAERLSSLGRLAATIAHEMNNVLMGIQPFGELIQKRTLHDEVLQNAAQQIRRSVQRGRRVTQEILRFTSPTNPDLQPVDPTELLESLLPEARGLLGPNIELKFVPLQKTAHILGDREQLLQLFTNLLFNARDAINTTGRVTIALRNERHDASFDFGVVRDPYRYIHISVSDTGRGMNADTLPRIFEPLFTTKRSGTGLGLAIVHQYVVQHRGEIFVESRPDYGTTFHIFLPLITSSVLERNEPTQTTSHPPQRRVLLVEDEPSVALGTSALLEMEGFVVSLVGTGQEALEEINGFLPDIIVLDVGLPDMSGLDLHDVIAERWPSIPVIVSTGHGDDIKVREHRASGRKAGFLMKPYGIDEMLEEIVKVSKKS
ncbi:MAG TPA: PAS domain S-box protein [Thermoanaerobaculia bacterium]